MKKVSIAIALFVSIFVTCIISCQDDKSSITSNSYDIPATAYYPNSVGFLYGPNKEVFAIVDMHDAEHTYKIAIPGTVFVEFHKILRPVLKCFNERRPFTKTEQEYVLKKSSELDAISWGDEYLPIADKISENNIDVSSSILFIKENIGYNIGKLIQIVNGMDTTTKKTNHIPVVYFKYGLDNSQQRPDMEHLVSFFPDLHIDYPKDQ